MQMEAHAKKILSALEKQAKTGRLCDVVFFNENRSVWAHSCVLANFSPFFSNLFSINLEKDYYWSIKQPMQINLKFITKCSKSSSKNNCIECLAQIVSFMYTGNIAPNLFHLGHLLLLCERFKNQGLYEVCDKFRRENSLLKLNLPLADHEADEINNDARGDDGVECDVGKVDDYEACASECKICSYISDDPELMKIHSKSFHSNNYKCLGCNFSHRNVIMLVEHIERECKSNKNICSVCLTRFNSVEEVTMHISSHSCPKPFSCSNCKRMFDRRSLWLKHVKAHYIGQHFQCTSCEKKFKTEAERSKHFKIKHVHKKFVCDDCGYAAPFSYVLERHLLKHRKKCLSCNQEGCDFQTSSEIMLLRHKAKHKTNRKTERVDKSSECSICHMKFALRKNLVRHLKIHGTDKIRCKFCNYETTRVDKYKEHFDNKHFNEERPSIGNVESDPKSPVESRNENPMTFSKEHNTLMMDDKGDISIVNSNEKNSVTLRNIGNLTGSITLDERTGTLTMNNINSGSVFLNEITGELTYVNLENDKNREMNYFNSVDAYNAAPLPQSEVTKLDEVTGEIIKVLPSNEEDRHQDHEIDSDVDLNDDSFDGFDDFDELLFDVFEVDEGDLDDVVTQKENLASKSVWPRLDESTGLLTFDENMAAQGSTRDIWHSSFARMESNSKDETYELLLDEVTGVLHD